MDTTSWKLLEDTKFFQDLAARYFLEDYQGQGGFSDMGQLLRMAKRVGLERDKLGLDLACGNGRPGLFVIRRNRCKLVGLGDSQEALEIGQHRAERYALEAYVSFVRGNLSNGLPFADNTFDGVISSEGFEGHNLAELASLYREVGRVLKPGGGFAFFYRSLEPAGLEQESAEVQQNLRQGQPDHLALLEQVGFGETRAAEVTGELRAMSRRQKSAYEERGVPEKLRASLGPALTDQLYTEMSRLHQQIANNQLHRWFFSAKKLSVDSYQSSVS